MVNTRSTPAIAAAASTMSFTTPSGVGTTMITSATPATFAGIAFISTEDGYAALPPGTYKPARSSGVTSAPEPCRLRPDTARTSDSAAHDNPEPAQRPSQEPPADPAESAPKPPEDAPDPSPAQPWS